MRAVKLLLCIVLVLALVSCTDAPQPAWTPVAYLDAFAGMNYDAMWALCQPAGDIDKDAFVQKYEAIFSGLGVTEIEIGGISEPDEDGVFHYTATYHTQDYGDFTDSFALKTVTLGGERRVLWDHSLIFPELDAGSSVRVRTLRATRGEMFAADGSLLAANAYADTLYMDTGKVVDIAAVASAAGPLTGLTDTQVIKIFNDAQAKGTQIVALGAFFADTLTEQQRQSVLEVQGLGIDDRMYTPIRDYPLGESAAHITGYIGYATGAALPAGYTESDKLGLSGLEASYETQLRGRDGKLVCIEDRWGRNVRTLFERPVEQGQDLWLTVKPRLQQQAYELLSTQLLDGQSGVAIVMDASTGFVEAMASYPSFDNNMFTFPVSKEAYDLLMAPESNQPLYSRATQGLYPPGSVFKPFTAAAALEAGAVTPETVFDGQIVDNKWTPDEEGWSVSVTRIDYNDSGAPLQLHNAMVYSDNIYFAFAALRLGEEKFLDYLDRIGLKDAAPFDLKLKKANLVNNTSMVTPQLLADTGYGQGQLQLTPIQLAAMYTAFAGGTGDMLEPVLVQKLCRAEGEEYVTLSERTATTWISGAVSKRSLRDLAPILADVIQSGTGKPVRIRGVGLAGKTGTAEVGNDKSREISWFAGYWTEGYYNRLVVVMVDVAAEEGHVKFDIAKALLSP